LALGGGAAKGFAHVGVIKVLEAQGITPEIVTGTSAGSVVGALYASGMNTFELQQKAVALDEKQIADFAWSIKAPIKGEKLEQYVNQQVKSKPIEQFPKLFGAVATEQESGKRVVFRRGNAGQAVRASASIPNIFQPVLIQGKHYVDGGLVSPVPVSAAKEMGADFIIAVDISARPSKDTKSLGILGTLDQSINILSQVALEQELKGADIVIRPAVTAQGAANFDAKHQSILEGEKAAQAMLPLIKKRLAEYSK
jgi:NTE family protein